MIRRLKEEIKVISMLEMVTEVIIIAKTTTLTIRSRVRDLRDKEMRHMNCTRKRRERNSLRLRKSQQLSSKVSTWYQNLEK